MWSAILSLLTSLVGPLLNLILKKKEQNNTPEMIDHAQGADATQESAGHASLVEQATQPASQSGTPSPSSKPGVGAPSAGTSDALSAADALAEIRNQSGSK